MFGRLIKDYYYCYDYDQWLEQSGCASRPSSHVGCQFKSLQFGGGCISEPKARGFVSILALACSLVDDLST